MADELAKLRVHVRGLASAVQHHLDGDEANAREILDAVLENLYVEDELGQHECELDD